MERAETEEAIAIMQAWVDGKTIQYKYRTEHSVWTDIIGIPKWSWIDTQYRVKPRAVYRPYDSPKECLNDLRCDGWLRRREGATYYTRICNLDEHINYQKMFREYTYIDGTPFGLKIS